MKSNSSKEVITVISLGCSKNLVESERLLAQLKANNIDITHDKLHKNTSTVIINTCGFIEDAKQQSIETILNFIDLKEKGKIKRVYVIGCLSQRYKEDLKIEIPDVDNYFGSFQLEDIVKEIGLEYKNNLIGERVLSTPSHYAYFKIAEGCDRTCSFCAIPIIKGGYKSSPIENLINEAKLLANNGVKELILIAQDLTYYGLDLYKKQSLSLLLNELCKIDSIKWIRLHYAYPAKFPMDLINVINEHENICKYLDIPIQHITDNMLNIMKRNINRADTEKLLNSLKLRIKNLTLRTTILSGHPGETKKDHQELLKFINDFEFDRLGVFTYSHEEDTYSFKNFKNNISDKIKNERKDEIMLSQMDISLNKNKLKINNEYKVIIDEKLDDGYIARSESDSPDVDNKIIIETTNKLKIGNFYNVKIIHVDEYDLYASL